MASKILFAMTTVTLAFTGCRQSPESLAQKEVVAQAEFQQRQADLDRIEQQKQAKLHRDFEQKRAESTQDYLEQHARIENARAHAVLADSTKAAEAKVDDSTARDQVVGLSNARIQRLDNRIASAESRVKRLSGPARIEGQEDLALIKTQRETATQSVTLLKNSEVRLKVASKEADQKIDDLERLVGQLEKHLEGPPPATTSM